MLIQEQSGNPAPDTIIVVRCRMSPKKKNLACVFYCVAI
jgi:hypothetical protein